MSEPTRILVAGDWHANTRWAVHVVEQAAKLLAGEPEPLIIQLGDFGIWPGPHGADYIRQLALACSTHNVNIWFIDGNHEDFTQVGQFDPEISKHPLPCPADSQRAYLRITHLPRGQRWEWHGRTWLALGGAVSVDKAVRTEGDGWWPQEEITRDEAEQVVADGPADVMITHDAPSGITYAFPPAPAIWDPADLARAERHRDLLRSVVRTVAPRVLIHGHYHRYGQQVADLGYGPVQVTALDRDGSDGNYAVFNARQLTWESA